MVCAYSPNDAKRRTRQVHILRDISGASIAATL
jgi:hypothetical protein